MTLPLLTQILHGEGEWPPMRIEFNLTYAQDMSHSLAECEDQNFSFTSLFSLL